MPDLVGPAVTPATAARHAAWADALITVNQPAETLQKVMDAYRNAGGRGPARLQIHLSWAPTEDEALAIAHDQWRNNVFAPPVLLGPRNRRSLRRHRRVRHAREQVAKSVRVSSDLGQHAAWLNEYIDQGWDELYLHFVGQQQTAFIDAFGEHVLPQLSPTAPASDRMRKIESGDLWWKNAVFYCADIETFYDWNGDGTGDIRGMTERIEYLADLGVTCLWLMPFYPTARKDDGYDITDFFGVDPRLGNLGDFVELVRTARSNGIRVIVDFVMNHTSDAHPWFKSARRSKDDPYRDYYVWSATEPKGTAQGRRLPRPGGQPLGARPQDRRVVPAPLLQAPARPEHRQSESAGGDFANPRILAAARSVGIPRRRRAVPVRRRRRAR